VRALGDEPLPLFAAAQARKVDEDDDAGSMAYAPEIVEPPVALRPMTAGREVVEDYGHVGLTLRAHPLAFLREDLRRWRLLTCAEATARRDRSPVRLAGIVLVRQKPGSAKGVLFITLEDETGVANLVIWPQLFEASRRIVLGARLLGVEGQVQREGEVVHIVARRLHDMSDLLDSLGKRDAGGLRGEPANKSGYSDMHRANTAARSAPRGCDSTSDVSPKAIRLRPRDFR
ncbi:OB-fold nucleic acid binding domain-containing protein, partial [Rubellimicrobium roseum]